MGRSRNFFQGGSRSDGQKIVWTTFFFFSPQLILQLRAGVQRFYYRENYTFSRIKSGSNNFQGGGFQLFPGGPNAKFYRNLYNLWFSRGGGVWTPCSPSGSAFVHYNDSPTYQHGWNTLIEYSFVIQGLRAAVVLWVNHSHSKGSQVQSLASPVCQMIL